MPYEPDQEPELDARQDQHPRVSKRQREAVHFLGLDLHRQLLADDAAFVGRQPPGVLRADR